METPSYIFECYTPLSGLVFGKEFVVFVFGKEFVFGGQVVSSGNSSSEFVFGVAFVFGELFIFGESVCGIRVRLRVGKSYIPAQLSQCINKLWLAFKLVNTDSLFFMVSRCFLLFPIIPHCFSSFFTLICISAVRSDIFCVASFFLPCYDYFFTLI
jgi:hypothetical protein